MSACEIFRAIHYSMNLGQSSEYTMRSSRLNRGEVLFMLKSICDVEPGRIISVLVVRVTDKDVF